MKNVISAITFFILFSCYMQFAIGSKIEPVLYSTKSQSIKEYNVNESRQKFKTYQS